MAVSTMPSSPGRFTSETVETMAITLRQLRVFVTIVHEGSLTAAAQSLHLTKPAVSAALAELEKRYGHRVFDRHHNRLFINDLGRQLLPLADELLGRAATVEQLFDRNTQLSGQLRIGASYTIGHQLLPALLQGFRRLTGHTDQQVTIVNSATIGEALNAFELDIGMVEGRIDHAPLMARPWRHDRMLVAAAPDHPLVGRVATVTDLEHQQWVLREPGSGTREQFMHFLAARLEHWQTALELNATEAIINATAAGMGLTCVSELEARHALADGRLRELGIDLAMPRQFHLITHRDKYISPLLARFLEFCQQPEPTL
ncbi:LysR substrate-binding domain-containing protein [Kushneria phosphatilytica]|nr:LysR substrate-binding domain-containing protein [Kushneria phosphatilytica]